MSAHPYFLHKCEVMNRLQITEIFYVNRGRVQWEQQEQRGQQVQRADLEASVGPSSVRRAGSPFALWVLAAVPIAPAEPVVPAFPPTQSPVQYPQ